MNFDELQFTEPPLPDKKDFKVRVADRCRYIIGADPYDEETREAAIEGFNVFVVFDKIASRVTTKIKTHLTFDEFVEKFLEKETSRVPYVISKIFITADGKPNFEGRSIGSQSFEGYNPSL